MNVGSEAHIPDPELHTTNPAALDRFLRTATDADLAAFRLACDARKEGLEAARAAMVRDAAGRRRKKL